MAQGGRGRPRVPCPVRFPGVGSMQLTSVSRACFASMLVALLAGTSAQAATVGTLRIGVDFPVSGADAAIGVPTQNGAVLAIEEANKRGFAGGKYKLEASLLDDAVQGKHDPAAGAQNVKTFI